MLFQLSSSGRENPNIPATKCINDVSEVVPPGSSTLTVGKAYRGKKQYVSVEAHHHLLIHNTYFAYLTYFKLLYLTWFTLLEILETSSVARIIALIPTEPFHWHRCVEHCFREN